VIVSDIDEFNRLYQQSPLIDTRVSELNDRLHQYYKETKDCDNKQALERWREFKRWCMYGGYTQDEINKAKRTVSGWRV